MRDYLHRVKVDWGKTLEQILRLGAQTGPQGVFAFDLDSTVFDNRPRQARIVREYGMETQLPALTQCQPWHFTSGWDLRGAMKSCGLSPEEADAKYPQLKAFWQERFFTSEYCRQDIEIVGAPRYLQALVSVGARLVYVTGRHEEMRDGTQACLERCGMPQPDGVVELLMKPRLADSDDEYKRRAHAQLRTMGTVMAAFDNEPLHINDYAAQFETAIPVHLATDHSGRDVPLHSRCVSVPHFAI